MPVNFSFTAPCFDQAPSHPDTVCGFGETRGAVLTDLYSFQMRLVRFDFPGDTLKLNTDAIGVTCDSVMWVVDLEPGIHYEAMVIAIDAYRNESCVGSHFVGAIPAQDAFPGLHAGYFVGQNFEEWASFRSDSVVAFQWGSGGAWPGGPVDNFSVRWDGSLLVPTSGDWTFYVYSDDGIRFHIDGALVQDYWIPRVAETANSVYLASGPHAILLEYFEAGGAAFCELRWAGPGVLKQIVPASVLSQ